jgi:Myosin-like coiled-coil protein
MEGPIAKVAEKIAKKTREEKLREQKIESEILKSLNGISDPDQKFQALLQRCVEAERISRSSQLQQKQHQKTIETLLLEKDHLAAEHQRILSTKSKLESLCRELQSQNKTIKVSRPALTEILHLMALWF